MGRPLLENTPHTTRALKEETTDAEKDSARKPAHPTGSEEDESGKIHLYKRMLKKTRHIQLENRRLRRRSPQNRGGEGGNGLCLNPAAVQKGAFNDGNPKDGQAPSLTSTNNFINFCVSSFGKVGGAVIMNGVQQPDKPGCNGVVMGMVPDKNHMPACKFISPKNLDTIKANTTLTITLQVRNIILGVFTNPKNTYLQAPVQLDPDTKSVLGHTHVVVQPIDSLDSTKIPDPTLFIHFKGVDAGAKDEKVSVTFDDGVPEGTYRISTITTAANHQPISSPIAQRSIFDDIIYITATKDGSPPKQDGGSADKNGAGNKKEGDKKGGTLEQAT
ncbi:hypothetical protein VP01_237g11 [Puccinia sorghi]|uniref:Uncharacterized protein n=1 Tax=Puccinia sorghi TaxID=27349 RepID=A0A0L6V743_9BASI|nr:hypothetical protein VP01_237g11 [Puccinia sorghi]